ncbi:MAG: hypothetical protein EBR02_05920 [Alphaproteobacteria bacterium]|nr:hypothetical protein [Alphaproteobacteria bacterium]
MTWVDNIKKGLELPGKFLANGAHAQQAIPAQHRLLNASVMCLGWAAGDQIRDVLFGVKQVKEGEYVDVPLADVPAPLRFLHKAVDWNPYSEDPKDQWKKLAYQMIPGVGAGLGAVAGSAYAFELNKRAGVMKDLKELKGLEKLWLLDADSAAQYSMAAPLRAATAFFGTFSAASGLTFVYGLFLNTAFAAANGARIFTGGLKYGNAGPAKALDAQMGSLGQLVKSAVKGNKKSLGDAWSQQLVDKVLEPMFGHELQTLEQQAAARKAVSHVVEEAYQKFASTAASAGKTQEQAATEIAKAVTDEVSKQLGKSSLDNFIKKKLGWDIGKATLGNANSFIRTPVKAAQDLLGAKNGISGWEAKMASKHSTLSSPVLS